MGFVWSVPISSKGKDRGVNKGGGETYHKWGGGPKTVFGEALYGMFSPLLSFPPPLCFSSDL